MVYWNFCIPNELVETKGLMLPIMEARDLLKPSGLYPAWLSYNASLPFRTFLIPLYDLLYAYALYVVDHL